MRLRTFTAPDIHAAMAEIRKTLGDDAVIISTTRDPMGKSVSVTAAAERDDPMDGMETAEVAPHANNHSHSAFAPSSGSEEAKVFIELKAVLAYHSVPEDVAQKLLATAEMIHFKPDATYEGIRRTLSTLLDACFQFLPLPTNRAGFRLMLVGPPGIGKTMTIAKIAAQLAMEKKEVMVITTDTKRAGGVEQLQAYTDILRMPLKVAEDRSQLMNFLKECGPESRVLIDTSGTNPYDAAEIKELMEFMGISGVEPVLTMPSGGDAREAAFFAKAFLPTGAKRLLMTRVDISRRYGSILSAAAAGYALCNSSSSSKVVGEYRALDAETLSSLLMQYRLEDKV
jgi:flagellar biosynthesis protein FlhF